jgi:nicotinamide phosphoribosyltransferase
MDLPFENNILLKTDSYKVSHHKQYPPGTTVVYAYLESRGGNYPEQVVFGLQYILKKHLIRQVVTEEYLEQATQLWSQHFGYDVVDRDMWEYIIEEYDEYLPIRIKAVSEGTIVPTGNVLMTGKYRSKMCLINETIFELGKNRKKRERFVMLFSYKD